MKNLVKIARLIRFQNLIIISITMFMTQYFLVCPILGIEIFDGGMNPIQFILLITSTLLISIGGYIINDVFDINPDSINKPDKNLVGSFISTEAANNLYWITTISGVLLGTLVSYLINQINFGLIFLFSAGLLWFYSQKYSCQPLLGNIVISVLSAVTLGLVWLFEFYALSGSPYIFAEVQANFPVVSRFVFIYMGFAFIITLIREIVKDIEDYIGDDRFGCRTLPVRFGISVAKSVAITVSFICLVMLLLLQIFFSRANYDLHFYWFALIDVFMLLIIFKLQKSSAKEDYSLVSKLLKYLMLAGILSMVIFKFI